MIATLTAWLAGTTSKLLVAALALVLCLGLGAFLMYRHYSKEVSDLQAAVATAQAGEKAAKASIEAKAAAQATVAKTYVQRDKDLTNALQTSQDWASTPVPDAVYDSLFPSAGKADPAR